MKNAARVAACAVALAASVRAEVVTIGATADTFMVSSEVANNGGGHTHATSGTAGSGSDRRALFQFDLSGLPPGATVTSVQFAAQVVNTPSFGPVDSTFDLFAVYGEWVEGVQVGNSGAAAAAGECTWSSRQYTVADWTNAGGDFAAAPLAAAAVGGNGGYGWEGAGLQALVQAWLDGAAENHGLLLISEAEGTARTARGFATREGGAPATLTIGYDLPAPPPPPPPPVLAGIAVSLTNVLLTWTNLPGQRYDVLYARDLRGPQDWRIAEAGVPADPAGTNRWTDPPLLAGPLYATGLHYAVAAHDAGTSIVLRLEVVASNLVSPVAAAHAGDGSGRLFIAEQQGAIRILDAATNLLPAPFLDLSGLVTNLSPGYDERGLLGLAFHPAYAANRRFYVYYSAPKTGPGINHESIVAEYQATATNANLADPASARIVLRLDEPEFNHNGGALAFGPDGYLYIATGDGGGAGDAHGAIGNAQNRTNLLGKILRIDVDGGLPYAIPPDNPFAGGPGAPELFAWGFRNPWKMSFEGTNLWVADVGQNLWEEIDVVRRGGNYGWRIAEGSHAYDLPTAAAAGVDVAQLEYPLHEYRHGAPGISIIGGAMYRGTAFPALTNRYVFGDFSTSFGTPDGALYYLEEAHPGAWERFSFALAPTNDRLHRYVKGFGRDEAGELYLLSSTNAGPAGTSGDVRKLLPAP